MKKAKGTSKSEKMRKLYDEGMSLGDIAKKLQVRYQFVYNVIDAYTNGNIRKTEKGATKTSQFIELFEKGHTPGEIAKLTNSNYNFVYSTVKRHISRKEG